MASWTQVYIKGLEESVSPTNEELEDLLDTRYSLSSLPELVWAGPGTTLVKRSDEGICRGYAFLSFLSTEGASKAVEKINHYQTHARRQQQQQPVLQRADLSIFRPPERTHTAATTVTDEDLLVALPLPLYAELSKPKAKSKKTKKKQAPTDHSDVRLRRPRGAPVRKHPVIKNSDGTKTGLGNKTK